MSKYLKETSTLIFKNQTFTSEKLVQRINIISHKIMQISSSLKRIFIYLEHEPDFIMSMISILNLGLTYIPASINIPDERLKMILEDSKPDLIITKKNFEKKFVGYKKFYIDSPIEQKIVAEKLISPRSSDVAYIIYTSGSTGKPKGVEITYSSIDNFINAISNRFQFRTTDRIACLTSTDFDIFFLESVFALGIGMTVVMAEQKEQENIRLLCKLLEDHKVSILQTTPSRLQLMIENDKSLKSLLGIQMFLVGGENFPIGLLRSLQERTHGRIYNLYGPTEATIWATVSELTNQNEINIGTVLDGVDIHIVNEDNAVLEYGEVGEIVLSGNCLAKGYLNDPILTSQKFVFLNNKRAFKTGDIGVFDQKGNIIYCGRMDNQIKHHGYRIELEEIEHVLENFSGISRALAFWDNNIVVLYTQDFF